MTWIIKFLFFLMFLMGLRMLFTKLFAPLLRSSGPRPGRRAAQSARTVSGQTVKDPQCGMYVATNLAISVRKRGETFHFCSEKCRDQFFKQ